jgi:hypothetical protein
MARRETVMRGWDVAHRTGDNEPRAVRGPRTLRSRHVRRGCGGFVVAEAGDPPPSMRGADRPRRIRRRNDGKSSATGASLPRPEVFRTRRLGRLVIHHVAGCRCDSSGGPP